MLIFLQGNGKDGKDFVFVLTQKLDLMILEFVSDGEDMKVLTRASGQIVVSYSMCSIVIFMQNLFM